MRRQKLFRRVSLLCAAVGLAVAIVAPITVPAWAGTNFDGAYDVEVTTDVGPCDKTYHGVVTVQGGHVVSTGDVGAKAYGIVATDGTVSLQFQLRDQVVHAAGRMAGRAGKGISGKGTSGKGTWSAPMPQCGGRWRARRQG